MRFNIDVPDVDLDVAATPEIGGESNIQISYDPILTVGTVTQPAPASGELSRQAGYAFPDDGCDLVLRSKTAMKSTEDISVTVGCTFADNTVGTATATFAFPSWVYDQSANTPIGIATDFIPDGEGNSAKKIKAISGIEAVTGGLRNNVMEIMQLPDSWIDLRCPVEKNETLPVPQGLSIPCGLNASAFTKFGRSEEGQLELTAKNFSYGDGLSRLNGHSATVMVLTKKDGRVLCERSVYGGYRAAVSTPRGDGDDEVIQNASGRIETFLKFV